MLKGETLATVAPLVRLAPLARRSALGATAGASVAGVAPLGGISPKASACSLAASGASLQKAQPLTALPSMRALAAGKGCRRSGHHR